MTVAGPCRLLPATPPGAGAIAILQLHGDVRPLLAALTGLDDWPIGRLRLAELGGADRGLAGRLAPDLAEVMPHGGPRVVQRLTQRLLELGVRLELPDNADPIAVYPEAADESEALMLGALARARSPLAVDLLLGQSARWRARPALTEADEARSRRLNRLIDPPIVVLAGPPNVGKSTLSNALFGRAMSIALEQPGTTRDYTAALFDLAGLVVRWHDTPGLGESRDPIERKAIALARRLMERAEMLIAMTDAEHDWPALPRAPDLRVASRTDLGPRADADLAISALRGDGLADLIAAVRDRLVPPEDLGDPGPWRFDPRLPRMTT